ncbi:MAG: septum formation initiator family protein [Clostridiales bacterium]|nr:septum formation initiator family protein [Roseburia sp.]MDD7636205.1 septum formation initiator family protein [Clostridiales bacterium]MDY4113286.1 septum formation initiator family protein [Roseburia sp.]
MAAAKRIRKDNNRAGKICISMILIVFVIVMSVQIVKIYQKDQELIETQAEREAQLEEETARQQELEEYEAYTQTNEYIEDVAKSKLGLAYDNEIIFKEED